MWQIKFGAQRLIPKPGQVLTAANEQQQQQQQQQQLQPPPSPAAGWRSDAVELRALDIRRSIMPSTTRGNPGEVISPVQSASPTSKTPPTFPLPPFRPRPRLICPSTLSDTSIARLLLIGPRRRHPPHSSHAACARFRLAKKKSPGHQSDIATNISAAVTQLETHAQRVGSQIQIAQALFIEAAPNHIHFIHPASSSNPPSHFPNSTQHILCILQRGLASRTTVAPPESRSRALPPPFRPFSEDAIT
ncbi:hypothetical protein GGX14DRAFT_391060 [Mycena pura]|uniref:Uncharacterized protein n=1 Tax=Mycena pura TaxID=153505 RepID=A0AAD6YJX1_9AGAR|nr:hypothetical protein GGX14DRAFT_391060 [Mycena pura]